MSGMKIPSVVELWAELPEDQRAAMPPEQREMWESMVEQHRLGIAEMERLASERKFRAALGIAESQDRADRLIAWDEQYHLTDDEVREVLESEWSHTEAWSGDERLRNGMMGFLRRVAPLFVYGDDDEREHVNALSPEPLTIYRGNLGEPPGGGSWTLDPETAERFATQMASLRGRVVFGIEPKPDHVPTVWRALIDPRHILGYFNDRAEREVVVDDGVVRGVLKFREAAR